MIPHVEPYLTGAESKAAAKYLKSGGYLTEHNYTEQFEKELANFLEVEYVSLVTSGTAAIYLSLLASGLPKGSRVLVPDITMIATYNAVLAAGMKPILVDVNECCGCMDLSKILPDAEAMIYVDLNGQGFPTEFLPYCQKRGMVLIEDACQSFGSEFEGIKFGNFGRFACFSLGFHKIITTGQGGFVVTHNREDYEAIEKLKDFGRLKGGNDKHDTFGLNFKFTDLQAVIGIEQLKTIQWRIKKKKQIYYWYFGHYPNYVPWFMSNFCKNLNKEFKTMTKAGVSCRKMYPPIHTQKFVKARGKFYGAEFYSSNILWYPSSLSLTKKDVDYIKGVSSENF